MQSPWVRKTEGIRADLFKMMLKQRLLRTMFCCILPTANAIDWQTQIPLLTLWNADSRGHGTGTRKRKDIPLSCFHSLQPFNLCDYLFHRLNKHKLFLDHKGLPRIIPSSSIHKEDSFLFHTPPFSSNCSFVIYAAVSPHWSHNLGIHPLKFEGTTQRSSLI